jgi:signal transduction histidine kinase
MFFFLSTILEVAIPQEHLEHIFKRFYRADSSRAREQGGYGLGLSIAKTIVDNHQGKISVESNETDGTTFIIKFPLK